MAAVLTRDVGILVVDDHPVVRDGVEMLAQSSRHLRVVGYAATGAAALEIAQGCKPDIILLDVRLPDMLAPDLVRALQLRAPASKIILFTAYPDHPAVTAALEAGAYGVWPKDTARMDLAAAIARTMQQDSPESARDDSPRQRDTLIARREYDVLRRVARGETNGEIAEAMALSLNTVKTYLRNVMHKLGARNRVEAISKARERGLL
ncbi:MAG TPA: response regulator transcription factor [Candidatus Baltobacteraceae bacterium]|nr:response regulator transcription factor [Candidatus Baltobacteraceae bacterium]